jgi:DNA invertase Pin-like site-specific DNA recombinase
MPRTAKRPKIGLSGRDFVAYYRVSTAQQGASGLGLDAQRNAVQNYLRAAGADARLLGEYTEVESGKSHKNRPQLAAAIAQSKRTGATLVIAKLDRLARNVHFISGLMEAASDFVAVDMPSANKLTLHIMAAMAEQEREMTSSRTKAGLDAAKREIEEKGFRISRRSGQAYSKHGNPKWAESIERARAARAKPGARPTEVQSILSGYKKDALSLRKMAGRLNGLGLSTPSGADWHPSSVRSALQELPEAA